MAVPRNRHSTARKNSKRAHHAKTPRQLIACSNCRLPCLPHHLCPSCGFYGSQKMVEVEDNAKK